MVKGRLLSVQKYSNPWRNQCPSHVYCITFFDSQTIRFRWLLSYLAIKLGYLIRIRRRFYALKEVYMTLRYTKMVINCGLLVLCTTANLIRHQLLTFVFFMLFSFPQAFLLHSTIMVITSVFFFLCSSTIEFCYSFFLLLPIE